MRSPDATTDQFFRGVCDAPSTTIPPAKIVSFDGAAGVDAAGMVQRMAAAQHSAAMSLVRMRASYRNSALPRPRCAAVPMKRLFAAAAMLVATAAFADGRFSASDVPQAHIRQPGRIVIRNSGAAITAYRFFGNIREALFSLRTAPARLRTTSYGAVL